jgi:hypothetical protein
MHMHMLIAIVISFVVGASWLYRGIIRKRRNREGSGPDEMARSPHLPQDVVNFHPTNGT